MSTEKQGKISQGGNWITPKVRFNWVHVFKAQKGQKRDDGTMGEDKFSCTALFEKDADFTLAKKVASDALVERFGERMKQPAFVAKLRKPFRDQGEKANEKGELPPGYTAGCIFITASGKQRPGVVDANGADILQETDIYSGCYGRLALRAYTYDNKGNVGVAFGLQNVQKLADGEPLGGRSRPSDDFEPVAQAETAGATNSVFD